MRYIMKSPNLAGMCWHPTSKSIQSCPLVGCFSNTDLPPYCMIMIPYVRCMMPSTYYCYSVRNLPMRRWFFSILYLQQPFKKKMFSWGTKSKLHKVYLKPPEVIWPSTVESCRVSSLKTPVMTIRKSKSPTADHTTFNTWGGSFEMTRRGSCGILILQD